MIHRLSVAPMMDWTDRHCRVFHRRLTRRTLLYTEMVTARALIHGDPDHLLRHAPEERPLALQLGGSVPEELAAAVGIARGRGFCEINLNVGCPSDRVQDGAFGACLMRAPARVADCVAAMIEAAGAVADGRPEITVKCRIGVDEQDPALALPALIDACAAVGVRRFAVHARKAWLDGLSPKENRTVPPLDYPLVRRVRAARPGLAFLLNGGIDSLDAAIGHLAAFDGAMVGRAAYHDPVGLLAAADRRVFGEAVPDANPVAAVRAMYGYVEDELAAGTRLNQITRHMLGAFAGRPGARRWRQTLSEGAHRPGAGIALIERALGAVLPQAA
jgi:tRNA-dihydrouridine synthase A